MCNFLIGGKTGASRSLAAYLSDHNSLSRPIVPEAFVRPASQPDPALRLCRRVVI
jgi:hypothetical protein